MISRAIEIKQGFLDKIFKRKSVAFVDVNYENRIFLSKVIDNEKYKVKKVFSNPEYPDLLIVGLSFKSEYFDEIDQAIKKANDNAKLVGFTGIDEVYDKLSLL